MSDYGFLVDLQGMSFDEGSAKWIMAMPLGTYHHPEHGEIKITPERISHFAENVKNNVRGQDLPIDYDHREKITDAAGWVRDAEARTDGLWLLVEWTKTAFDKIKERAFRYFSPEYHDEWTHPVSQQKFTDVLFGGGLTNRPFLKGIVPINLTEVVDNASHQTPQEGGDSMTDEQRKALAKHLKLSEDSTEAQIFEALAKAGDPASGPQGGQQVITATEVPTDLVKLAETNPAVKTLLDLIETNDKKMAQLDLANKLSEASVKLSELDKAAADKKYGVPPVIRDQIKEILLEVPKAFSDKVFGAFEALAKTGFVPLGESAQGPSKTGVESSGNAIKQFDEKVTTLRKEDTALTYNDAVRVVSEQNPDLWEDYTQAMFEAEIEGVK